MFVERKVFLLLCENLQILFWIAHMCLLLSNIMPKVCLLVISHMLEFEDTYRLPDKRHREQLIMNFEIKHVNKYGDNDIKPYR